MYTQDFFAASNIWQGNHNAAVEAPRTQQCRFEHVRPVGGSDQDYAFVGFKAVHLNQQLVEGLFTLIVSAAETSAAVAAYSVNLINKDDARGILLALLKQVANAACADADKHLYEVGTGDAEEGHIGFTGYGARQQGLAGSRMSYQQDAFRDTPAKLLEFLGF